jgi:hypothetical protein
MAGVIEQGAPDNRTLIDAIDAVQQVHRKVGGGHPIE